MMIMATDPIYSIINYSSKNESTQPCFLIPSMPTSLNIPSTAATVATSATIGSNTLPAFSSQYNSSLLHLIRNTMGASAINCESKISGGTSIHEFVNVHAEIVRLIEQQMINVKSLTSLMGNNRK